MAISINADPPTEAPDDQTGRVEDVNLAGEGPYPFTYPPMGKVYGAELRIRAMKTNEEKERYLTDVFMEWLARGFGPAAWNRLIERIEDDSDPLQPGHLLTAFRSLQEAHAGRPTTSSNGASPSPWAKISTDEPSPQVSDSSTSDPVISVT
jgi:hypothetical protein